MLKLLGLPLDAAAGGPEIDTVLVIEHWMIAVLFVFWIGYFLYALVRFRRGANPRASYAGTRSYWAVYIVFAIAAMEGVLLVAFEIPQWRERTRNLPSPDEAVVVRVVAEQFAWNVQYPGPDGKFGRTRIDLVGPANPLGLDLTDPSAKDDITAINQLNVPVGRPVLVHLSSKDVIHSFGVPAMRVKQDAIPGVETPVWFVPARTGQFDIACSQLCGLGHYRMRGFLLVQTPEEFEAWLADQEKAAAP
jgi:cytochrome c oxidase subunit 2